MAYLVIAYPNLSEPDYDWLQSIRKKHDQQFDLVKPHVTLVFGTEKLSQNEFIEHVQNSLTAFSSFPIILDSTKVVGNDSKDLFHAFLVPSNGFNEVKQLHDVLYQGALESELRSDIPFIPHLTIGSGSKREMTALVEQIGQNFSINGNLDRVSIIEFDGTAVKDTAEVSLP
jgi:2'-5' RNA ligase